MEVIIKSRRPQLTRITCSSCSTLLEFELPPGAITGSVKFIIQCHNESCGKLVHFDPKNPPTHPTQKGPLNPGTGNGPSYGMNGHFKFGSDEKPLTLEYYELLGVPHTADTAEIKKSYYRLAMKFHPDKNDGPDAEEMFKKISEAYQVLIDPVLRKKYNEFGPGQGSTPDGGFMNPEDVFKMQFGGELFVDIIGELQIGRAFKQKMMENAEEENGGQGQIGTAAEISQRKVEEFEARKKAIEERVIRLSENLTKKLMIYVERGADDFSKVMLEEVEELKVQSYGVPLLQTVGYVYSVKGSEYISKYGSGLFTGIESFGHRMRLKGNTVSGFFSTVKSAVDAQVTVTKLQKAEQAGASEAERVQLNEEMFRRGTDAIWKTSKLEVESVIRRVCDKTLADASVDTEVLRKRSEALKIIGDIYQSVTL